MLRISALVWIVIGLQLSAFSYANDSQRLITDATKSAIEDRIKAGLNVGIALAVLTPNAQEHYLSGQASVCDAVPLTPDSVFEIGSVTKLFTAILTTRLVQKNKITWQTSALDELKQCQVDNPVLSEINFSQLVTHTAGLPRLYEPNFKPKNPLNPYQDYSQDKFCEALNNIEHLGTGHQYSNLGYGLLGALIEDITEQSLESAYQQYIFQPLGLNATTFNLVHNINRTMGHIQNEWVEHWYFATLGATGGLKSSLNDMILFMQQNLILPDTALGRALRAAQNKMANIENDEFYMGAGWHVLAPTGQETLLYHNGATGGYASFVGINRTEQKAVVVLSNSSTSVDDIGFHSLLERIPLNSVEQIKASLKNPGG